MADVVMTRDSVETKVNHKQQVIDKFITKNHLTLDEHHQLSGKNIEKYVEQYNQLIQERDNFLAESLNNNIRCIMQPNNKWICFDAE